MRLYRCDRCFKTFTTGNEGLPTKDLPTNMGPVYTSKDFCAACAEDLTALLNSWWEYEIEMLHCGGLMRPEQEEGE